jgi:dCMP deaminase
MEKELEDYSIDRVDWNALWMDFAISVSNRSCDPKHTVGAVIIDMNNEKVLSFGYNGDEKGGSNKRDSLEHGKSGFLHAEINALIKYPYGVDAKMYVTLSPCIMCAKAIINAGIKQVIYLEQYCEEGIELLEKRGVLVKQFKFTELPF